MKNGKAVVLGTIVNAVLHTLTKIFIFSSDKYWYMMAIEGLLIGFICASLISLSMRTSKKEVD